MHKYTHVRTITDVDRYIQHTLTDPECPEEVRIRTPVRYRGTVKLHGSNCGVCCTPGALFPQSREQALDLARGVDLHGFAAFVASERTTAVIRRLESDIRQRHHVVPDRPLYLYGEWCGPGIMHGVALNKLPTKQWVLFGARSAGAEGGQYLDAIVALRDVHADAQVHSIMDGPTWSLEVDFSSEQSKQSALDRAREIVVGVENECPWAARFGVEGVGEGVVWIPVGNHFGRDELFFKVKGDKHATVKSKRDKPLVAPEVLEDIAAFVEFAIPETRLEQGIDHLREHGQTIGSQSTGQFLKWIAQDVQRECAAELDASGLLWNQVGPPLATRARTWFMSRLDRE